jgi:hypothetical protein
MAGDKLNAMTVLEKNTETSDRPETIGETKE